MSDESVRSHLTSSVPDLDTQINLTSIGSGLREAFKVIRNHPLLGNESCPNILLLTDGEENTAPFIKDVCDTWETLLERK